MTSFLARESGPLGDDYNTLNLSPKLPDLLFPYQGGGPSQDVS